jgi:endonuclease/exonuclease/phosphatase family metal-dependent hydrolase
MRRIIASLALAFVLALPAAAQDAATESAESQDAPAAEADEVAEAPGPGLSLTGPLTIVTANAWSGLTDSGIFARQALEEAAARDFRLELLAEKIAALQPQVVTLGEANPVYGLQTQFADALDMVGVAHMAEGGVRIGPVGLPANLREGDIILSAAAAQPVLAARRALSGGYVGRMVSFQTSATTQIVGVELKVNGRPLYVFHTRWYASPFATREDMVGIVDSYRAGELESAELLGRMERAVRGAERRLAEARRTVVTINEVAGDAPVILTGTLNALPGSAEIAVLEEAGFVDAYAAARGAATAGAVTGGVTWDPGRNSHITRHDLGPWEDGRAARLDYIFVRGDGLRVIEARVVLDEATYGVYPSPHFGVLARITLPEGGDP